MKVKWGEALKNGLLFCFYPNRWLPFFVIDFAFVSTVLAFIFYNLSSLIYLVGLKAAGISLLSYLLPLALIVVLGVAWVLIRLWIGGAIIYQSWKPKEFKQSWKIAYKKYLSLLAVMIVISVVSYLLGLIPYIGFIFTILISLVFFFAYQGIMVKNLGFYEALVGSWKIFKANALKVFIMWLLIAIISGLIIFLFSIPALAVFWFILSTAIIKASVLSAIFLSVQSNIALLLASGLILFIGSAISSVFSLKVQTEFYLQFKKFKIL